MARARRGRWRTYEVLTKVELAFPKGVSRVWLPLPMRADTGMASQSRQRMVRERDARAGGERRQVRRADTLRGVERRQGRSAARGDEPGVHARAQRRSVEAAPGRRQLSAADRQFFTAPTDYIPTDGIVRKTAQGIVKGAGSDVAESARHLRMGRGEHVPRPEGARLRLGRYQIHARDRQHGRQVR